MRWRWRWRGLDVTIYRNRLVISLFGQKAVKVSDPPLTSFLTFKKKADGSMCGHQSLTFDPIILQSSIAFHQRTTTISSLHLAQQNTIFVIAGPLSPTYSGLCVAKRVILICLNCCLVPVNFLWLLPDRSSSSICKGDGCSSEWWCQDPSHQS